MELNCCNQDKILIDTELLLMNKQIKWFSEMETATGVAEFEKIDSNFERNGNPLQYSCLENPMDGGAWWATWGCKESDTTNRLHFERSSTVCKMLSNSIACYRGVIHERKSQLIQQASKFLILRNYHRHPSLQQSPP